jgi:hypothetical protein
VRLDLARAAGRPQPAAPARPRAAAIVAWLQILQGLGSLLIGLAFTLQAGADLGGLPRPLPYLNIVNPVGAFERGVLQLLLAYPILWVGFGLFHLRRWAWLGAMMLQGIVLFINLVGYFRGRANLFSMAMSVLIVFYLNQAEVREAFHPAPAPAEEAKEAESG